MARLRCLAQTGGRGGGCQEESRAEGREGQRIWRLSQPGHSRNIRFESEVNLGNNVVFLPRRRRSKLVSHIMIPFR